MHASHTDATGCPCTDTLHVKMAISDLVECAVNLAEKVTGVDIDRDGDIGVRCPSTTVMLTLSPSCLSPSPHPLTPMLPPSLSPLLRVWQDKRTNTGEKQLDDAVQKKSSRASTLPDISANTPKVSLFKFTSMGPELIKAASDQVDEFADIAVKKAKYMWDNQKTTISVPAGAPAGLLAIYVQNATGVRLSLKSSPTIPLVDYPPPDTIEPGECASFLVTDPLTVTYEVQVFEGPFPFPPAGGGWQAPTGDQVIPQFVLYATGFAAPDGIPVTPSTAKGAVQDMGGGGSVSCTFTWSANLNPGVGDQSVPRRFTIRQSIP